MPRNRRVLDLLEEMLNTAQTPEEVCCDCPELLPDVLKKWATIRRIDTQLEVLLPSSDGGSEGQGPRRFASGTAEDSWL